MTAETVSSKYKHVEGLARGLGLLHALSEEEAGRASIAALAAKTGIHRTTVKRLLETLAGLNYVQYDAARREYALALKVRQLSDGFQDERWITEIAGPALSELVDQVVWPSDLTTPKGGSMIIRETTRRFSPFSFHRSMVGTPLPMLVSSVGRAYLGFCSEAEREAVIRHLQGDAEWEGQAARIRATVGHIAREAAELGHGHAFGSWVKERKFGAVALPVTNGGRVVACINVVFLTSSMTLKQARERFLKPLRHAAQRISKGLGELPTLDEV